MPRHRYVCALTPDQQLEVRRRLRQQVLAPRLRRRLETVRLAGQGWRVGCIAEHLGVSAHTVRRTLQRFMASGLEDLADRPKAGRLPKLSPQDLDAAEGLLRQAAARQQAWTMRQVVAWLAATRGVVISPTRLGVWLRRRGYRWTTLR
jgi:transposase